LEAENAVLREQLMVLVVRVQEPEAQLAKDNHNSKPFDPAVTLAA
jgi:hypothetical protein